MKQSRVYFLSLFVILLLLVTNLSAQAISNEVQDKIDEFMNLRMNLASYHSNKDALDRLNTFKKQNNTFIYETCTPEETLIMENFILLEEYNYTNYAGNINGDNEALKALYSKIIAQHKKNEDWISQHSKTGVNKYLYATAADITACYMSMESSLSTTIKYGLLVKDYYEKAIAQDSKFSYALINLGQWHFFAPAIAGGGKNRARTYFEKAVNYARNKAELYFAKIYYSQLLFEQNDKKSHSVLDEAETYCPSGTFISRIRNMNKNGISLFSYQINNSAVQPN